MDRMKEELDKRLEEAKYDMYRVLRELLDTYYKNRNSSGKCPHPSEFIACVTPEGIPLVWKKAKMIIEYIEALKEGINE